MHPATRVFGDGWDSFESGLKREPPKTLAAIPASTVEVNGESFALPAVPLADVVAAWLAGWDAAAES